jgi:hypothetical protein
MKVEFALGGHFSISIQGTHPHFYTLLLGSQSLTGPHFVCISFIQKRVLRDRERESWETETERERELVFFFPEIGAT